ncbi:MAG: hypothetical protein DRI24_08370 [Deltaproteobacteria bacterium]|nr:MAG: hypothetical protein DRI24_08370 [Deltaproteobacteria bacterium]
MRNISICVIISFFVIVVAAYFANDFEKAAVDAKAKEIAKVEKSKAWKELIREKYSAGLDGKPLVWGMLDKNSMKYQTIGKGEVYGKDQNLY